MNKPRLLDLFCGAGGAAMGYHRAGFRMGRPVNENSIITPVGHFSGCAIAKKRMGIDWEITQGELAQAIPPAYTEYIGNYLMQAVLELKGRG